MAKIMDYIGLPNASLFLVAEASAVEQIDNNGDVIIAHGAEMTAGPMFQEHYSGTTWPRGATKVVTIFVGKVARLFCLFSRLLAKKAHELHAMIVDESNTVNPNDNYHEFDKAVKEFMAGTFIVLHELKEVVKKVMKKPQLIHHAPVGGPQLSSKKQLGSRIAESS